MPKTNHLPPTMVLLGGWLIVIAVGLILYAILKPKPSVARRALKGIRVGDVLGKTHNVYLIVSKVVDFKTITFRTIRVADLPKAETEYLAVEEVRQEIINESLQESDSWLNDYVADFDFKNRLWTPRTKKGNR